MSSVLSFQGRPAPKLPALIGCSPAIQTARQRLARFASNPLPVLLVGPTGTGKELLARHLHGLSGRIGELIDVDCGPETHPIPGFGWQASHSLQSGGA